MTDRPNKRQRSESYGETGTTGKTSSSNNRDPTNVAPAAAPVSTRPRRAASGSTIKVTRDETSSPEDSKKALRLTVKMPSSKLREATSSTRPSSRGNAAARLKDSLTGGEIVSGPRTSRANKKYVVESESEEEDDDEDEDAEADDDDAEEEDDEEQDEDEQIGGPEESDEEEADEEDEEDADAEPDVDADGDVEMEDDADDGQPLPSQPQPILKVKGPAPRSKPTVTVTPAQDAKVKSVEAKEMSMDDDDEELSDLSEDEEGDVGEEDAEGEDVDEMDRDDDDSRSPGSRASTPDVSKMTKRQRSRLDQVMGSDFLQLPMEPQTKKHLTAEEHAMRRAEMARRRKNLSEKRNEEEKMDTINRLLKKQAPKRRGKISAAEITAQEHGDNESPQEIPEEEIPPANPVYVRWVSDRDGCRIGVPGEWLGTPVGRVFGERKVVEEV